MNNDQKSIEIIDKLFGVANQNNIKNSNKPLSFNKQELIDDYFKEMEKNKLWFIQSFKFKLKKFLRLYFPHLFLFLKKVKKFNGNK